MSNCCRSVDGVCDQCNEPCAPNVRRYCTMGPKAELAKLPMPKNVVHRHTPICAWLGQPTEEMALVKCHTCNGRVRVKKILYDCPLFGRCLPKGKDEANAQQCMKCPSHTARSSATSQ